MCGCHSEPPPIPAEPCDQNAVSAVLASAEAAAPEIPPAEETAWRDELSARLDRYRARRKMRPPRYPSLLLQFDAHEPRVDCAAEAPAQTFDTVSHQALALNEMEAAPAETQVDRTPAVVASAGAKIIEFPRFAWAPPAPPPDELGEPVGEQLRILDVPEVAPPAPALGGITIEPAERKETAKRPGIDVPLQSAPLARRVLASVIDGLIVGLASAMFAAIFWKVTGFRPPLIQIAGLAIGMPCLLWAAYQYLLVVYAGRTPGLRLAGLELTRFDGARPRRSVRRWRVLGSYLSAASLGMGYAWVFLDEDLLCWHDRITHTYLAQREPAAN